MGTAGGFEGSDGTRRPDFCPDPDPDPDPDRHHHHQAVRPGPRWGGDRGGVAGEVAGVVLAGGAALCGVSGGQGRGVGELTAAG